MSQKENQIRRLLERAFTDKVDVDEIMADIDVDRSEVT